MTPQKRFATIVGNVIGMAILVTLLVGVFTVCILILELLIDQLLGAFS